DADAATIRLSHKRLVKHFHPDRNPDVDTRKVALINAAYEVLSDPRRRAAYDAERAAARPHARGTAKPPAPAATRGKPEEAPWPDGFDVEERVRRQARMRERFAQAAATRATERAQQAADAQARREVLARDKAAAAERLAAHRTALRAKKADVAAQTERDRKAEMAKEVAAKLHHSREGRLRAKTRPAVDVDRPERPIDRFRTKCWEALRDTELSHTRRRLPEELAGSWETTPEGVRWRHLDGNSYILPRKEIDWALGVLFREEYLSRLAVIQRLSHPDRFGAEGNRIGRALFTLLARLPFFEMRREPLALSCERHFWESML
ncbi:MAG: DnaJ domain-containing protein, partial [bacterium]